jgi:hypothetical protein
MHKTNNQLSPLVASASGLVWGLAEGRDRMKWNFVFHYELGTYLHGILKPA